MATANDVLNSAAGYLGTRYKLGGESSLGMDCSGLIYLIFQNNGILDAVGGKRRKADGYVQWAKRNGRFTEGLAGVQRGDLIVYDHKNSSDRIDHIGIYAGGGKVISALINPWGVSQHNITLPDEHIIGYIRPEYTDTPSTNPPPVGVPASWSSATQQQIDGFNACLSSKGHDPDTIISLSDITDIVNCATANGVSYILSPDIVTAFVSPGTKSFKDLTGVLKLGAGTPEVPGQFDPLGINAALQNFLAGILGFVGGIGGSISHAFIFLVIIIIALAVLMVGFRVRSQPSGDSE